MLGEKHQVLSKITIFDRNMHFSLRLFIDTDFQLQFNTNKEKYYCQELIKKIFMDLFQMMLLVF